MDPRILKLAMENPDCPSDLKTTIESEIFRQACAELDIRTDKKITKSICKNCLSSVGIDKSIYMLGKLYDEDKSLPVNDENREKIAKIAKTAAAEIYIILGGV